MQSLLSGHSEKVNAVKFLSGVSEAGSFIVSGAIDKTIRLWRPQQGSLNHFETCAVLTGHEGSINVIAAAPLSGFFVSGSADATVRVWKVSNVVTEQVDIQLVQTIKIKPYFIPLALALSTLSPVSQSYVLAVAGTTNTIQIYVSDSNADETDFHLKATLTGHEGWIRSLSFAFEATASSSDLLLASASQDKYIRLWRTHQGHELPPATVAGSDPAFGAFGKMISNKAHRFRVEDLDFSITFEALLLGHEDWIYATAWRPRTNDSKAQLLSASADNSLAIWESDLISGVWVCNARLGEISVQKGSTTATGSTGGFWTGLWSPKGDSVVSLGRTGSWRLWTRNQGLDRWVQQVSVSGHIKEVTGISWSKGGKYLLSTR